MKRVTSLVLSFLLLFTLCAPALAATGFVNAGTFNNHAGATFNNSGVFENSGTVSNNGTVINFGQFKGSGTFISGGFGTFDNRDSGLFTQGKIRMSGGHINQFIGVSSDILEATEYQEAVDVVRYLGILGDFNGELQPGRFFNRAEGAKMLACMLLGQTEAENLVGIGGKYDDIPASHWASGYIEYLASVGIGTETGGSNYDPNGAMTAGAFARMLLFALGYDLDIERLTGQNWLSSTSNSVNQINLLRGNESADLSAAITRDEAALYVFNTLQTPVVQYADSSVTEWEYRTTPIQARQTISDKKNEFGYLVELGEDLYPDLVLTDNGDGTHTWVYDGKTIGTYSSSGQPVADTVSTVYLLDYASSSLDLYYSGLLLYLDGTTMEVVLTNDADALPAMKGRPVQARVVGEKQVPSGSSYVTRKTVTLTALDSVAYGEADASVAGDYAATPDQVRLNVPGSSAEIRCNLKTVFLLRYTEEDDVYVYTGLKNVPYTKMVEGTVVSAALGADGYAESVLIVNPEATRAETMLVLKKAKTAIQTAAGETYYLADVFFSGESQPRKNVAVESDCIDTLQTGVAYSAVTMNSHGRISGARPLANDRTAGGAAVGLSAAAPITYTDGTISLPDAAEGHHLAGPVTLALGPGTSLLSNQGADYEFLTLTGESLAARLDSAASYTYNYFAALNSADAQTIDSLMIWISATGG